MTSKEVYWEWYCSLFPKTQKKKHNPELQRCQCGYTWKFSKWQLVLMLIKGSYVHTCPQCLERKKYVLIYHVVKE